MTRSSHMTVFLEAGSTQAIGIDSIAAEPPFGSRLDASPFYVDEPDIPEGMTCVTWRRRRQTRPKPGLLARVRVRH